MQSFRPPFTQSTCKALRVAFVGAGSLLLLLTSPALPAQGHTLILPEAKLAKQYFGADAPWFLKNVPFLEIDDPEIQSVYYYRWNVWRSHIRQVGPQRTDETEFLTNVPWARQPYTDLNDSSSLHIMDGRWLRDPAYVNSLVDHLYTGAGNDRHFSEFLAAATYAWVQVTGDPAPALRHLDTMKYIYNMWDDHFDAGRNLYWIEPLLDATEYTIASIDASGAGFHNPPLKNDVADGFLGGFAFRPSINSYQFANAEAISSLARHPVTKLPLIATCAGETPCARPPSRSCGIRSCSTSRTSISAPRSMWRLEPSSGGASLSAMCRGLSNFRHTPPT